MPRSLRDVALGQCLSCSAQCERCPLRVNSRPEGLRMRLPLYPRKRTQNGHRVMSVSCQTRKSRELRNKRPPAGGFVFAIWIWSSHRWPHTCSDSLWKASCALPVCRAREFISSYNASSQSCCSIRHIDRKFASGYLRTKSPDIPKQFVALCSQWEIMSVRL
jgi:hypothetical protein